jgi:hypothetical protein
MEKEGEECIWYLAASYVFRKRVTHIHTHTHTHTIYTIYTHNVHTQCIRTAGCRHLEGEIDRLLKKVEETTSTPAKMKLMTASTSEALGTFSSPKTPLVMPSAGMTPDTLMLNADPSSPDCTQVHTPNRGSSQSCLSNQALSPPCRSNQVLPPPSTQASSLRPEDGHQIASAAWHPAEVIDNEQHARAALRHADDVLANLKSAKVHRAPARGANLGARAVLDDEQKQVAGSVDDMEERCSAAIGAIDSEFSTLVKSLSSSSISKSLDLSNDTGKLRTCASAEHKKIEHVPAQELKLRVAAAHAGCASLGEKEGAEECKYASLPRPLKRMFEKAESARKEMTEDKISSWLSSIPAAGSRPASVPPLFAPPVAVPPEGRVGSSGMAFVAAGSSELASQERGCLTPAELSLSEDSEVEEEEDREELLKQLQLGLAALEEQADVRQKQADVREGQDGEDVASINGFVIAKDQLGRTCLHLAAQLNETAFVERACAIGGSRWVSCTASRIAFKSASTRQNL